MMIYGGLNVLIANKKHIADTVDLLLTGGAPTAVQEWMVSRMVDRIKWYKTQAEGQRIIDMLKIVKEQILPLEPHEFGERSTVIKNISVESVDDVLSEAIRVIKGCYFTKDEILEQKVGEQNDNP